MRYRRLGEAGHETPGRMHGPGAVRPASADRGPRRLLPRPGLPRRRASGDRAGSPPRPRGRRESLRVGAPIARPGKVVCIGLNYRDHARRRARSLPEEPVVFMKDPSTVVGPFDARADPPRVHEDRLGGRAGRRRGRRRRATSRTPSTPAACIAGFMLSHDVSERAFQLERGGQWDKGKSCETFNPLGPDLVTPDEVAGRPATWSMRARGQRRPSPAEQHGRDAVRGQPPGLVPQPVHGAAPRRPHQHGDPGRRRDRHARRALPAARATWSSSGSAGSGTARQRFEAAR